MRMPKSAATSLRPRARYPGLPPSSPARIFPARARGAFCKDEVPLARGKTIYLGEPVAAVAARDAETARGQRTAIEIDYEPLPAVLTIDDALAADGPLIHDDLESYVKIAPSFSQATYFGNAG